MNAALPVMGDAVLQAAGWAVVHLLWQAALAAALLWVFGRAARDASARLRYRVAYGFLLALPAIGAATALVLAAGSAGVGPAASGAGCGCAADASAAGAAGGTASMAGMVVLAAHGAVRWIGAAWLLVVAWLVIRWAGGLSCARRLALDRVGPAPASHEAAFAAMKRRLGVRGPVSLRRSTAIGVPLVVGHFRPAVLVPARLFARLPRRDLAPVLAHELAHVRRRDYAANAAQRLVEALLFFHPAVRWMSRVAAELREQCCDDLVAERCWSRRGYARALSRLALAGCDEPDLAVAATTPPLLVRIRRMAAPAPLANDRRGAALAGLAAAAGFAACLALAASLLPPTAQAMRATGPPPQPAGRYVVQASDPAGPFTLAIEHGRAVEATVGGRQVTPDRLVQVGDSVTIVGEHPSETFRVRINPAGGISWAPRPRPAS